jgi:hypothetical protein
MAWIAACFAWKVTFPACTVTLFDEPAGRPAAPLSRH